MESGLFKYIFAHSRRQQLNQLLLTAVAMPFYYFSLDIPKTIVNKAIGGGGGDWPREYYFLVLDQIPYLMVLCGVFLGLVFINGGFKYVSNVYQGIVAERMLRRLRHELIARVLRFPLPQFRKVSQGEIVSMVTLETENLGGFFGEAVNTPAFQGGTLITLMTFMFIQDWKLGLAAIALYPVQMYFIPKLQAKVNALGKQRVQTVRRLSERIGEIVSGAYEIHANDTSQLELADFSSRLGTIYGIRFEIYRLKFLIKFLNNFLALVTPFLFYSIGGYLVIKGSLTLGALVAVLAAYKDVSAPWKILLGYYQRLEDARIKYQQLLEKFQFAGMLDGKLQTQEPETLPAIKGPLVASNVSWEEEDGLKVVSGASVALELPRHVALTGPGGSGKTEFAQLMARLLVPSGGRITINGTNLDQLPEAVTGRKMAYVGQSPYMFSGTIRDNLYYGLKHRPLRPPQYDEAMQKEREREIKNAADAGNVDYDIAADWIDVAAAGVETRDELETRAIEVLKIVGLEEDIFQIGLRRTIDPETQGELARACLGARAVLRKRLSDPALAAFVESFEQEKFNSNASVAENILFGTPVGTTFSLENLGENSYVQRVLEDVGLSQQFVEKGNRLAEIMVELFKDLPPDHEFFERFGFISSDDLPDFEAVVRRVDKNGIENISDEDVRRLRALPFKLIKARHHLDLIDEEFEKKLLEARRRFAEGLPEELLGSVQFFHVDEYSGAATIQDNILFGKIDSSRADSSERVGNLLAAVIEETNLRRSITDLGLGYDIGIGGVRLQAVQRQKLAIARALIKSPDFLVLNEATSLFDGQTEANLVSKILKTQKDRSVFFVNGEAEAFDFDQVLRMEAGRIVSRGIAAAGPEEGAAEVPEEAVEAVARAAATGTETFGTEVDVLAAIPLFAGLDRSKLKLMTFASQRFRYDKGQILFEQGAVGDEAYIIIDGQVSVILETLDGPKNIGTIGKGELFGELALLCNAPRSATIQAATDLVVLTLTKDVFLKLIAEDVAMSARITRAVADRLERTTRELSEASAVRDPVTDLPDERLFADRLNAMDAWRRRNDMSSMAMYFDIATIVDLQTYAAEEVRNAILREIAGRVKNSVRETDTVSRFNGTQFFILLYGADQPDLAKVVARRIAERLTLPIVLEDLKIELKRGIEFVIRPIEDGNVDKLRRALQSGDGEKIKV